MAQYLGSWLKKWMLIVEIEQIKTHHKCFIIGQVKVVTSDSIDESIHLPIKDNVLTTSRQIVYFSI